MLVLNINAELTTQQVSELDAIASTISAHTITNAIVTPYTFGLGLKDIILTLKLLVDGIEIETCIFVCGNGFSYGYSPDGERITNPNHLITTHANHLIGACNQLQ